MHGWIEVASIYTDLPDRNENLERREEDFFMFEPGLASEYSPEWYEKWIEEVSNPNRWRRPDQDLVIETEFELKPPA